MDTLKKAFAQKLLDIKAIKLQPNNPFTWASGWKSPFYCDNRKALSFPALRTAGFQVVGMVASYTYGFPVAVQAFEDAQVELVTLTDYEHVVEVAKETGYIKPDDISLLNEWRKDPANWMK